MGGIGLGFLLAFTMITNKDAPITSSMIEDAASVIGLEFTQTERDTMIESLTDTRDDLQAIREFNLNNSIPPALNFNPIPAGKQFDFQQRSQVWDLPQNVTLPENKNDLAFYTIGELSYLIKEGKISSVELTEFFLDRIEQYDEQLEAIITVTRERAMERAQQMDAELEQGIYRGPLHGIPYGAKDLLAVEGYKTTWGAAPYKDQEIDETATVIRKLDEAGAVLIAKTTLGALAYGDIWFGGRTNNPWDLEQGSSGSSAGSAAGTAAGVFPFAIGTETLGSIVSPSTRNGTTGLRPTYGRVSRTGAMALSWTMDKIGPITRSVEDAALVFNAIYGSDGIDQTIVDLPFNYNANLDITQLKIGYLKSAFEQDYWNKQRDSLVLETMRDLGVELIPVELPDFDAGPLRLILTAEGAAAFDQLTLTNQDDSMQWQEPNAWPNTFRAAHFIPATEYINANRARYQLIQQMDSVMQQVDVYLSPAFGGGNLLITNLTGHPSVVLPNGFTDEGRPTSITFVGDLFDEATVLSVAKAYQDTTGHHLKHPPLFVE
ncbi:Asp-tRNAAsn/Glu-tRNAGln amidotransferase A subunit [Gracilimonas mengyeensis]|uniref:Asp-tRNAAsn/Glu-tRNAGln amidotransferase A subunit n=2 Tax=Gracilimonas mengyeensis TaxID=1302730 RepID=A0A521C8P9_9BACT|nr:Asp-tRNAAsn/Glu-tRNAGln amidotransferase A subunit [Gracilimonas mengyeensis]